MNLVTFLVLSVTMGVGALLATRGHTGLGLAVWAGAVLLSQFLQMTASSRALNLLKALRPQGVDALHIFAQRPVSGSLLAASEEQLQVTPFNVARARTLDDVPVNVDAVVRWHMPDAGQASMTLSDGRQAMGTVARTLLGVAVHTHPFAMLLAERDAFAKALCAQIADKGAEWGAIVHAVEIQGVALPLDLEAENDARTLLAISLRLGQHRLRRAASAIGGKLKRRAHPAATPALLLVAPQDPPPALSAP